MMTIYMNENNLRIPSIGVILPFACTASPANIHDFRLYELFRIIL
jgi:hypothetical protein